MFEQLGNLIYAARERREMDQAQLAAQLGVGQQAVSRWELGQSRPRRPMLRDVARLLGLTEDELVEAGEYAKASSGSSRSPLSRSLPLGSLPSDRFEDLATELLQLRHPDGHASRFGGPGEKQFGIDVLVAATGVHNIATGQCKRRQQFGSAAVAAAVNDVSIEADHHYLFLSRETASPGARSEIGKHAGWELWDGEDIARFIRSQSPDRRLRLVDTYFPGERESFLGIVNPGPWQLPEDYFAEGAGQLVNHDWHLVGRGEELAQLRSALFDKPSGVAVLVGRGGTGKTRLLRALADEAPRREMQVFVLASGVVVHAADFELLPDDRAIVLLIDDAHDREDLSFLLPALRRRNAKISILIATRPYRFDAMKNEAARLTTADEPPLSVELGDLRPSDAEALAQEALGGDAADAVVHRLAQLTRDCPLVSVVGGVLLRQGKLDLAELDQDATARQAILRGYKEALVADPHATDPDTRNAVLDGISALQPFRTDDAAFRSALEALVGRPFDSLNRHLRTLVEAGILRRRGPSLRIAPDLLGDVVLAEACYDDHARATTGYLDRVRSVADGQVFHHLFVNVSRIDWHIKQRDAKSPSLIDTLWTLLDGDLRTAGIAGRRQLVGLLSRVAYFQPERVVQVARWLIDNPTDDIEDEPRWQFHDPSYADVLRELPAMLKPAAYTFETLPDVLRLLWELAQDDDRPTNQHPNHPLRVLRSLAEYEVGKPVAYNDALVDEVSTWFDDTSQLSPFDVLEPLLATEGSRQTYQEYTLTFHPFAVNLEAVMPVRKRLIDLALRELRSANVRRAVAAIHFLEMALRYPTGMFGRPVSDEEREVWTPHFVDTIKRIGEVLAAADPDPATLVAVRKALHYHASFSTSPTQPVAQQIVDDLRDELDDRVALILHDGWGHLLRERDEDYATRQDRLQQRLTKAASALCQLPENDITALLEERLARERLAFGSDKGYPGPLIGELIKVRPSLARRFVDLAASADETVFDSFLPIVLAIHAETDPQTTVTWMRSLVERGDDAITRSVAQAIGWNRGQRLLVDGERDLVIKFAHSDDPVVRHAPIYVAQRVGHDDPTLACELIAETDFSDSGQLAENLFMVFTKPYGMKWEMLTPTQGPVLRERLILLGDIDQHSITSILADRSATDPGWVVTLMQERIERGEGLESLGNYRPVPFEFHNRLRVREHPDFTIHLKHLHAWIAEKPRSWIRREMGGELFEEVARPYDEAVLTVLEEALRSDNIDDIGAVAAVVRKARRTIIWDSPGFVVTALHAAARFGDDCRREMAAAFSGATISGVRSGSPGKPYAEDIEQRDRSLEIAARFAAGSDEAAFYGEMARMAEDSIARSTDEDRADDGRDW